MKATELIVKLHELMDKDGDLEVRYNHTEYGGQEVEEITLEQGFRETVHHYLIH